MGKQDQILESFFKQATRLVESTSKTHDRLQSELAKYAASRGFVFEHKFEDRPDVLLHNRKQLFVGDAKVSANETAGDAHCIEQLDSYVEQFAELLERKTINGGFVAVATDDKQEARRWGQLLEELLDKHDVIHQGFRIKALSTASWMAIV